MLVADVEQRGAYISFIDNIHTQRTHLRRASQKPAQGNLVERTYTSYCWVGNMCCSTFNNWFVGSFEIECERRKKVLLSVCACITMRVLVAYWAIPRRSRTWVAFPVALEQDNSQGTRETSTHTHIDKFNPINPNLTQKFMMVKAPCIGGKACGFAICGANVTTCFTMHCLQVAEWWPYRSPAPAPKAKLRKPKL